MLVQLTRSQLDDRLEEHLVHGPQGEEVIECLGLGNLDRLAHADAVGQAGLLHGGAKGDQVTVRFGDGRIHRNEAVVGAAARSGDLGGVRIREQEGRRNQADTALEVQEARTGQFLRELVDEADVARPEQPFV